MWNPAPLNKYQNANAGEKGGIPAVKPKWVIPKLGNYDSFGGMLICMDNHIYLSTRGDIFCLNLDNGDQVWNSDNSNQMIIDRGFCSAGDYLLANFHLYKQATGKLLHNFALDFEEYPLKTGWTWNYEKSFIRELYNPEHCLIKFNILDFSHTKLQINLFQIIIIDELLLGWSEEKDYICYNLLTEDIKWRLTQSQLDINNILENTELDRMPRPVVMGDMIYLYSGSFSCIHSIKKTTGDIFWTQSYSENSTNLERGVMSLITSNDLIYIKVSDERYTEKHIALNSINGELIWKSNSPGDNAIGAYPVVHGDLLFYVKQINSRANTLLYAMDRYTGKIVWKAEDLLQSADGLIIEGNKIIFTNTFSEVRCYEWTEEYISPFKDEVLSKLISDSKDVDIPSSANKLGWFKKLFK